MLKYKEIKLIDIVVALMIIMNITFYNNTSLVITMQILCLILTIIQVKKMSKLQIGYLLWWCAFVIFCLASYIWSARPITFIPVMISVAQVATIGSVLVFYINNDRRQEWVMNIVIAAAILLALRMIILVPLDEWGKSRIGNYIGYGNIGGALELGYASLFTFYRGQRTRKIGYYIVYLILVIVVIFTGSKKGLLIVLIGTSLLSVLEVSSNRQRVKNLLKALIMGAIGFLAIMSIPPLYQIMGSRISGLITTLEGKKDYVYSLSSSAERIAHIKAAYHIFKTSPILGIGLDGYRYVNPIRITYAHNNYLELLCDLGLIGEFLYYSLPLALLVECFNKVRVYNHHYDMLMTLISLLFIIDVGLVAYSNETTHIILGIAYSNYLLNKTKE